MPTTSIKSYCRNCIAACGMELEIEHNRIIAFRGDKSHRLTKGYKCIKGQAAIEFAQSENRLLKSLKRQADSSFAEIDSRLASEEVGQHLKKIVAEHGPKSVAMYMGTAGHFNTLGLLMGKAWLSAVGSPNFFTSMTLDQSAKYVTIERMGLFASGKHDLDDVDAVMMVGANPLITHTSFWVSSHPGTEIRKAKRRGTKFVVIDPQESETARLADLHLKVKPGEDPALLAGMIRHILKNKWLDQDFCNYVNKGRFAILQVMTARIEDNDRMESTPIAGLVTDRKVGDLVPASTVWQRIMEEEPDNLKSLFGAVLDSVYSKRPYHSIWPFQII